MVPVATMCACFYCSKIITVFSRRCNWRGIPAPSRVSPVLDVSGDFCWAALHGNDSFQDCQVVCTLAGLLKLTWLAEYWMDCVVSNTCIIEHNACKFYCPISSSLFQGLRECWNDSWKLNYLLWLYWIVFYSLIFFPVIGCSQKCVNFWKLIFC